MQPMTTCNLTNNSLCISSTVPIVFPPRIKLVCSDLGLRLVQKHFTYRSPQLRRNISSSEKLRAVNGRRKENMLSSWDDKPYELLTDEERIYFDEQDVVAFLDPPKELIPLDPNSYNPARYLWKKIDDIPAERRYRLLSLLSPRLISRIWGIAGTRYDDSKLVKRSASNFLFDGDDKMSPEFWKCRTSGGPWPIGWIDFFKKAIFRKGGQTYGRLLVEAAHKNLARGTTRKLEMLHITGDKHRYQLELVRGAVKDRVVKISGGPVLAGIADSLSPLYFTVRKLTEVMSTEQPCDLAYEFGDGLLDLEDYPQGFPKAVKHPWPFNDYVVMYVRHVGPGVLVGQAWQEGKELEQVPKRLCDEILMVKDYSTS